ncbi:hypothetical protein BKA65DRAFT_59288 [Rhexocercosporidium sp. MPI-PUGE-AT-0058]|nr:hypothetical protein BKA65DRAFT_59288 [Rhexocercosporidium sp. MPI-PUGE-AT-0058]
MGQAQSTWHKEIVELTRKHVASSSSDLDRNDLNAKLQQRTNVYLRRKGRNITAAALDAHLSVLVRAHPEKNVALIACAHVLSRDVIRDLLQNELQVQLKDQHDVARYMQTILAVTHANPRAIDQEEVQCVDALLHLCTPELSSIGRHILTLATTLTMGVQRNVVFSPVVSAIPLSACRLLAQELDTLKTGCDWSRAYTASAWMAGIPGASPTTENFLNCSFPDWQTWALWRPDTNRLVLWRQLDLEQRKHLGFVLVLEGPDFLSGRKGTLREALMPVHYPLEGHYVSHEKLRIKLENGTTQDLQVKVNQILDILDQACSICSSAIPLFIHFASQQVLDAENLRILAEVNNSRDTAMATRVLSLMSASSNASSITIVKKLLPALEPVSYQGLREALSPRIVLFIEEAMSRLQRKLCAQLDSGQVVDGVARTLTSLGNLLNVPWLIPLLGDQLRSVMGRWPATEDVDAIFQLRLEVQGFGARVKSTLVQSIDQFVSARLAGRGVIDEVDVNHIYLLIRFWQETTDTDLRSAALAIAESPEIPIEIRGPCLEHLCNMTQSFVGHVVMMVRNESDMACINMIEELMSKRISDATRGCWRDLLHWGIDRRKNTLLTFALMHFSVKSWFEFLGKIKILFCSRLHDSEVENDIFNRALYSWADRLSGRYLDVLTELEKHMKSKAAMKWILTGWNERETILRPLKFLRSSAAKGFQLIIRSLLVRTSPDGFNAGTIFRAISMLSRATQSGLDICSRMVDLYNQGLGQIVQGLFGCWLQSTESSSDIPLLKEVAKILDPEITGNAMSPNSLKDLQATSEFLDREYDAIIQEALHLEGIRLALKTHDAQATSDLLLGLGMEDPSALEDAIAHIPDELIDVIEKLGPGELELSFPLAGWKPLQRIGSGVGTAQAVIVRLYLDGDEGMSFCIHLSPEIACSVSRSRATCQKHGRHHGWMTGVGTSAPDRPFCFGRTNRALYQLSRDVWRHLTDGFLSLEVTYNFVLSALATMSSRCVVCGNPLPIGLLRSTTCQKSCSFLLRKSSLEVRLADLRHDPMVVTVLFAAVLTVASSPSTTLATDLLRGNPLSSAATLRAIENFPIPTTLQSVPDLTLAVRKMGTDIERLLSWMCTSYRGFLTLATGALKVPSMPGVFQYVLASGSPEKETAFRAHSGSVSSEVVFHGTSFDRLYAILRDGLRILSTGPLRKHGASYGTGIYVADDPRTAWSYATQTAKGASSGWLANELRDTRVLLGCEMVASGRAAVAAGIHVVSDESQIMVRYIFICPPTTTLPIAAHIVPAMKSTFHSLRVGSV